MFEININGLSILWQEGRTRKAVAMTAADPPQTGSDSIQHGNQKQQAIKSSRQGAVADSKQNQCIVNTNALTGESLGDSFSSISTNSTAIKSIHHSRQNQCVVNTNALTAQIHQQRRSITSAGTAASGKLGSEGTPTSRYQTECDRSNRMVGNRKVSGQQLVNAVCPGLCIAGKVFSGQGVFIFQRVRLIDLREMTTLCQV